MSTGKTKQTFVEAEQAAQSDGGERGGAEWQEAGWFQPEPLLRESDDPAPFPLDALPPVAREAATAMATAFEAAPALAGQCVMAAIVSAGQAHADVYDPATGSTKPTCQKFLLIARSGDRKSTCDGVAFRAFEIFEGELGEVAEREARDFRINLEVFERMKRNAAPKRAASRQEIRAALLALGDPPQRPPGPKMLCSEPTFEGLVKQLHEEQPSAVIASGEAGTFFGGFAMSEDHRLKTAAGLSKLWDNGTAKRTRASERLNLNGRRVSLHLLSQPGATAAFLADEVLRSQGLHSRLLVSWPNRPHRTGKPRTTLALTARMDAFQAAVLSMLRRPMNTTPGRDGGLELAPPVYRLSPTADAVWAEWCAEIETGQNDGERLAHVCDLTNKAGEIALRLAASLACFENKPGDLNVTEDQTRRAVRLSRFYVTEKLRLFDAGQADPETVKTWALMLRIVEKKWTEVSAGDCVKWKLPGCPTSDDATRRLGTLDRLGWLRHRTRTVDDSKRGRPRGARFEVHPEAATHAERMRERLGNIGEMGAYSAEPETPEGFADSTDIAEGGTPSAPGDEGADLCGPETFPSRRGAGDHAERRPRGKAASAAESHGRVAGDLEGEQDRGVGAAPEP